MNRASADLQSVPSCFVHVELADGVLQAGLAAALWDGLGNGVHVELSDLRVIVGPAAGYRHHLLLLHMTAGRETEEHDVMIIKHEF